MELQWDDVRIFLEIYESGSMSKASRRLKVSQPTLSRKVAELEYMLGEALFIRNNQGVSLTNTGKRLLPAAQGMAQWASEAKRSLDAKTSPVSGPVSITAAPSFAFDFLAPFAATLKRKHPHITLKVISGMERLNLARGEVDIALRLRKTSYDNPDLIILDEIQIPTGIYASREYAQTLPGKYDFHDIDWIAWPDEYEALSPNPELADKIPEFRPVFTSDDYSVQVAACQAGVGAMVLLKTLHRLKHASELVELNLKASPAFSPPLAIMCHKRLVDLPKVRSVVTLLVQEFNRLRNESDI